MVSSYLKRLYLRQIWKTVQDGDAGSPKLQDALLAQALGQLQITKTGRVVSSNSNGGKSVNFTFPFSINPAVIAEMHESLLTHYEDAQAVLQAQGAQDPSDQDIFNQMMADMRTITGYSPNWMYLAK